MPSGGTARRVGVHPALRCRKTPARTHGVEWRLRGENAAAIEVRFREGECMRDNGNMGLRHSISAGDPLAISPSLRCSGVRGWTWLGRVTVAHSPRQSRQIDTSYKEVEAGLSLCPQEQRIVGLVMTGHSNNEIAHHFSLSESTIYRRIVRISRKVGVCNRFELLLFAISRQLYAGAQP